MCNFGWTMNGFELRKQNISMKLSLTTTLFIFITTLTYSQKLFKAVENADFDKVKLLLEKGEDPNEYSKNGLFPLWRAVADNNFEIAKLLIEKGANVKQKSKVSPGFTSSIVSPCQDGNLEMLRLLIENGVDVDVKEYRDFTPLRIAARNGHLELVKYLADKGAKIDPRQWMAQHRWNMLPQKAILKL